MVPDIIIIPLCPTIGWDEIENEKGLLKMVWPNHDEISEPYRFQRVSHKLAGAQTTLRAFTISSLVKEAFFKVGLLDSDPFSIGKTRKYASLNKHFFEKYSGVLSFLWLF